MKVIALPESTERLLEMIKEEVRIADDEEIIFNALFTYAKNIQRAKKELNLKTNNLKIELPDESFGESFWDFWLGIYEKCVELKKKRKEKK